MANVELIELTKRFGDTLAVDHLNLEVQDGEFVVLLGPSGCGKSTTLRMIAGLEELSEGEIFVDGRLVNYVSPKDRNVAMVFQSYALYPHMSTFQNLAFSLKMGRRPRDETQRRVHEVAHILQIEPLLERYPEQLSGGERQRVALGRAIVRNPAVFLMDEPLSNLDAILRMRMREELLKLHHRLKATTIYVTHDQVEAMTLGSRVVVLLKGVMQQVGAPIEVYDYPANTFVATFIGSPSMNLFPGDLLQEDSAWYFQTPSWRLRFSEAAGPRASRLKDRLRTSKVYLGIRPEDLKVSSPDMRGELRGEIALLEPVGADMYLNVSLGDVECRLRTNPRLRFAVGQSVSLRLDWSRFHLFDQEGTNLFSPGE